MFKRFKLFVSSQAEEDIDEIYHYYESESEGLGDRFMNDLDDKLATLQQNPQMYARFKALVRRGYLDKFPYSFYYKENMSKELINILAIFAQARNPEELEKELERRMEADS